MKTVIKPSASMYKATCLHCGSVYTYTREDVDIWYTEGFGATQCPSCESYVPHSIDNEYKQEY